MGASTGGERCGKVGLPEASLKALVRCMSELLIIATGTSRGHRPTLAKDQKDHRGTRGG